MLKSRLGLKLGRAQVMSDRIFIMLELSYWLVLARGLHVYSCEIGDP
jgi:hypothetical protein